MSKGKVGESNPLPVPLCVQLTRSCSVRLVCFIFAPMVGLHTCPLVLFGLLLCMNGQAYESVERKELANSELCKQISYLLPSRSFVLFPTFWSWDSLP